MRTHKNGLLVVLLTTVLAVSLGPVVALADEEVDSILPHGESIETHAEDVSNEEAMFIADESSNEDEGLGEDRDGNTNNDTSSVEMVDDDLASDAIIEPEAGLDSKAGAIDDVVAVDASNDDVAVVLEQLDDGRPDDGPASELAVVSEETIEVPQAEATPSSSKSDSAASTVAAVDKGVNVYRVYNPNSGEHFYTQSMGEAKALAKIGWNWEGCGWVAPTSGASVYRLYNPNAGDHHYTTNASERDWLVSLGWKYEGVGWLSGGNTSVLREYNPNAASGAHNFTTSDAEDKALVSAGWNAEGMGWKALSAKANAVSAFWLVCDDGDRTWVQTDAQPARDRLVTPDEGAGYYAYAKPDGTVVRGAYDAGDWVYLGDSTTGELPSKGGWLVTSSFGQGLQRYWLEKTSGGFYAAKEGYSTGGYAHYTVPGEGYVLRNGVSLVDGHLYRADNDGSLGDGSITGTGNDALDAYIEWIIVNKCGTGSDALYKAYNYIRSCPYISSSHTHDTNWLNWGQQFALEFQRWGGGNCYRYASTMTWVAIALGYDARAISGLCNNSVDHGWCEITLPDGRVRVIDCSLGNSHAYPTLNWYMISYHEARVAYYTLGHRLLDTR